MSRKISGMWWSQPKSASEISCAKSVGCGVVARSQLPAIMATAIQLSYLKRNSYKVAPAVNNVLLFKVNSAVTWLTSTMVEIYFGSSLANCRVPPYSIHLIQSEVLILNPWQSDFKYPTDFGKVSDSVRFGFGIHHVPRKFFYRSREVYKGSKEFLS